MGPNIAPPPGVMNDAELRQRAEAMAQEQAVASREQAAIRSPEAVDRLLHELRVHQIELELQNEELRRAQSELEVVRARYFDLYDLAPVGYITVSSQGLILEANLAAAKMLGTTRGALKGKPIHQRILKEDQDSFYLERKRLLETDNLQRVWELRMVREGGESFWVRLEASTEREPDGTQALRVVMSDINDRKRANDELRKLSRAVEQSPTVIVITDRAGNIEYANPQFERVTGYTRAEAVGRNPRILKSGSMPAETYADLWNVISKGGEWHGELCNRRKNGELFWESAAISGLKNDAGEVTHYVAVKTDITGRRRAEAERAELEAQLQQAQRMESVGRLAGGVAHDFNNMLGVILAHAELAMEAVDPKAQVHDDLEEIRKAATRSADLTRQLLAFARRQTVAPRVFDLNETVASMLKMLRRLIGENIELQWVPGAELWPVRLDPSQLDQILANLCVNAGDAIGTVGQVTIASENVTLDRHYCAARPGLEPGEYVQIVVSDDGSGMDAETLAHVFEPFFTTKEIGKGTGLGLATVYGIVKQNQGFISVASKLGKGSTITICLPRHVGSADLLDRSNTSHSVRGHETILLVEDEPAVLRVTKRMLEGLGYHVLAAGTPSEAMLWASEKRDIHLVLTDVLMPKMNGRDLVKNLLTVLPNLKPVFMSGYTADVIALHGTLGDGVDFIQKPFSRRDLAAKIREVLDAEPSH